MDLAGTGVWSAPLRYGDRAAADQAAAELEELGYSAIWIPDVGGDVLAAVESLLTATNTTVIATGILNLWMHEASETASRYAELVAAHGPRFLVGIGVSHAPLIDRVEAGQYRRPLARTREYLDALDAATPPLPVSERVLAALGPQMLALARDRARGVHPYLANPDNTKVAREALGPGPLLAPEQAVVLDTDPARARAIARTHFATYLGLPNYVNNLKRLGFTDDDVAGGGSDRLVDGIVAWGDEATIAARVQEHRDAGADHVCVQVLTGDFSIPHEQWRRLAPALDHLVTQLFFSTVLRRAPIEQGGELVKVDWDTKRVLGSLPIWPTEPEVVDPNPRGGCRGGRGVARVDGTTMVASYHSLLFFDDDLREVRRISHPLFAGLHEVHDVGDGTAWVASTSIDAAYRVDLASAAVVDQRWPRERESLRTKLGIEPLEVDKDADNRAVWLLRPDRSDLGHLHLNAVVPSPVGLLGLCNHPGIVVDLDLDRVVIQHPDLRGAHNLVPVDDGRLLTSGTTRGSVNLWNLATGRLERQIPLGKFGWVKEHVGLSPAKAALGRIRGRLQRGRVGGAHALFVRGMARRGDELFVGISPAAVLRLDWRAGTLIDAFAYSDDVHVCVHGIAVA